MKISLVRNVKCPVRGTGKAAGIDFFIPEDFEPQILHKNCDILIPSGVRAKIPEGFMLMAADKSGVVTTKFAAENIGRKVKPEALTSNIIVGAKIVDEDYQGEIHIHVINVGWDDIALKPGFKIAQFILVPVSYEGVELVPEKDLFSEETERGEKGIGLGTGNN